MFSTFKGQSERIDSMVWLLKKNLFVYFVTNYLSLTKEYLDLTSYVLVRPNTY